MPIPPHIALFLICLFFAPTSTTSLNSDALSLLALKAAIDSDPTGVLDPWSDSDSHPTPCRWPGVVCAHDRVTQLYLPNKALTGYLPSELGLLHSLKRLSLPHNNFSKVIPSSLFNATRLVVLDLSHNSLSGPIPTEIGSLKSLRHLDLSNNFLNATLPRYLSDLTGLVGTLNLSHNFFSGGVPESLGRLPVTVSLDLQSNNLTGKIPQVGFNLELEDLLRASADVVGKSRSGIVYKVVAVARGSCPGTVVAVRRLSEGDATWRLKEFESEVEAISRVHHPNIVPLRAYYYANDEKLLITDFIRNGSLHTALHGHGGPSNALPTLSWAVRLKIAQGAARGLMYIHDFSGRKYVHGNLKSTKILLDDDLHPYISGFGFTGLGLSTSKLAPKGQSIVTSSGYSKVGVWCNNYLAPEVRIVGGKLTQKCDVYSFGIVLLELLTGGLGEKDGTVLESFVRKAFREEQALCEIIDPALLPEAYAKKQVIAAFHIALNCTELEPEMRPRMRTVSESLDRIRIHY
ncbi:receptor protein kinase-like protein ZAR1 [Senna tora]|uniref:Receptor protein kinase-like protein ZAR1 n=1 Tax=Senna tora TaxID=362788 RepID=A0A834SID9_9FABA|nr:receptor protein kinase-like protein ZAR1 [Senna tora]